MSASLRIRIPLRHEPAFVALASLSAEQFARLLTTVSDASEVMSVGGLAQQIAAAANIELPEATTLVEMLVSLYGLRREREATAYELVDAVSRALAEARDRNLRGNDEGRQVLATRVGNLVDAEGPLRVLTKASALLVEHEHILLDAHIATDLRPVFKDDIGAPLAAAVIIHKLQLTYMQDGERRTFYVALDTSDIEKLRSVVDRADLKAKSLQTLLASADVPLFGESG